MCQNEQQVVRPVKSQNVRMTFEAGRECLNSAVSPDIKRQHQDDDMTEIRPEDLRELEGSSDRRFSHLVLAIKIKMFNISMTEIIIYV